MYEIFGLKLNVGCYIVLFVVCQFINVALNTAKTIIMHKEEKVSSAIINAITYGFYAIIVVMTASSLPLWITIVISALTNLIGVYGSMWVLERFKKDKLWEIVATVDFDKDKLNRLTVFLKANQISFNMVDTWDKSQTIFYIYSKGQNQSALIKRNLDRENAKYIVHEERVRL